MIVAESATDGLPPTTTANVMRNKELADKYDSVLDDRQRVATEGIVTFADLISRYQPLFAAVFAE